MRQSVTPMLHVPIKKQRALKSIQAGCINWQPEMYEPDQNATTVEALRVFLLNFENFNLDAPEELEAYVQAMKNSFIIQRYFFNDMENNPTALKVNEMWPCLLKRFGIFYHFNLLTGHGIDEIEVRVNADSQKLLVYGHKKKFVGLEMINATNMETKFWAIIQTIFKQFNDNPKCLFILVEVRFLS